MSPGYYCNLSSAITRADSGADENIISLLSSELGRYYAQFPAVSLLWLLWRAQLLLADLPTSYVSIMLLHPNSPHQGGNEGIVLCHWGATFNIPESAACTTAGYNEFELWGSDEGVVWGEGIGR